MKFRFLKYVVSGFKDNKSSLPLPAIDMADEAYATFENLLGSTGMDKWHNSISGQSRESCEILAVAWIEILEFAERTNTRSVLVRKLEEERAHQAKLCSNEMGVFARAKLYYDVLFPEGHQKK